MQQWLTFLMKFFIGYALIRTVSICLGVMYAEQLLTAWDAILYLGIFSYLLFFVYARLAKA